MIRFENPWMLLILLVIPPILFFIRMRYIGIKRNLLRIYTEQYLHKTAYDRVAKFKLIVIALFIFSLVLGISGIQREGISEEISEETGAIIFVLDLSQSMYARNSEGLTRMNKAINFFESVLEENEGMKIMILGFSDSVIQLLPLSLDYSYAYELFESIKNTSLIKGSTDITKALLELDILLREAQEKINTDKTQIFFVSDGESHITIDWSALKQLNIQTGEFNILSVGKGREQLMIAADTSNQIANKESGFLQERGQELVFSQAEAQTMQKIAQKLGADYINLENLEDITQINIKGRGEHTQDQDISWIAWLIGCIAIFLYIITMLI